MALGLSRVGQVRLRWPEWASICLFATLVAAAIPFHEPFCDEAQAWQLARTVPLRSLFATFIRCEGSPGLWHFFLWILVRAHVTYTGMHWICGLVAVGSTALLVLYAPFPRYLKLALPFTFFLLFQYAVVARSYVLAPPLFFLIALWWKRRPLLVAIALGLLANLALHTAVISGGLALVYLLVRIRAGDWKDRSRRRTLALCSLIVMGFYVFAIWTAWPPPALAAHIAGIRARSSLQPLFHRAVASLTSAVCEPSILSVLFWFAMLLLFFARKRLLYLLPVLFFVLFSVEVKFNFWHLGLLMPLLVCSLWISWPEPGTSASFSEVSGRGALAYMIAVQIVWSFSALYFDHYHAYSPDLAAAEFLRPHVDRGERVAVTYADDLADMVAISTGLLPYFNRNIFINQPDSFYRWDEQTRIDTLFDAALPRHPQIVLAEMESELPGEPPNLDRPRVKLLLKAGYKVTNVFCGSIPFRRTVSVSFCHVFFQYSGGNP